MKWNCMKTIYLADVHIEYEFRKSWSKFVIQMTVLTDSIFEINKHTHSIDYIKKHLPTNSKNVRFRIRKINTIKEIGKSFYYK